MNTIKVGIIGASAESGWARESHVPAILANPNMHLVAVATTRAESAKAAAAEFGAKQWYDDPYAMIASDAIDLVVVCVKVPAHRDLVVAALAAGKHVMCEWPLGRDVEESEALAKLAQEAGVHTAVGLQGRMHPAVAATVEAMASPEFGQPLSARMLSTTIGYAPASPDAWAYLNDIRNGANLSTISGGHSFDMAIHLLGPIASLSALAVTQHPKVTLTDTNTVMDRTAPDHIVATTQHENGCVLSVVLGSNRSPTPFNLEIVGSKGGIIALNGGDMMGFQAGDLTLTTSWGGEVETAHADPQALRSFNMTRLYQAFALDIQNGTQHVGDFAHAAKLSRLLNDMLRASSDGKRICAGEWPRA